MIGDPVECPFCRIADKHEDAVVVYEDADVMAFLDRSPIRDGHTQIIPKRHFPTFDTLPLDLAARIVTVGQQLARRLKSRYGVERVAFVFTGGDVAHAHAHIVPMHEPTDITSARYIVSPDTTFGSLHLRADRPTLLRVRDALGTIEPPGIPT